jgi:hypothetical protein
MKRNWGLGVERIHGAPGTLNQTNRTGVVTEENVWATECVEVVPSSVRDVAVVVPSGATAALLATDRRRLPAARPRRGGEIAGCRSGYGWRARRVFAGAAFVRRDMQKK